ncbi:tRNA (adenine(58)-N(1))-methyltransferase catalytic subunit TRMT61A [Paenibacillus koleovorans]|nr:tRNA (adenine(58)-N(1))-methyltransferase catalytic subunit TRMT61A [Paenibacillus koleovorans]
MREVRAGQVRCRAGTGRTGAVTDRYSRAGAETGRYEQVRAGQVR